MFNAFIADLWKKESNEVDANYVDLFGDGFDTMQIPMQPKKCNKISTKLRTEGNTLFNSNDWLNAMEKYNESLRYAEVNSENVSLAYGNRSSCFLWMKMYENCLVDIELAIKANTRVSKLQKRKDECFELMKSDQTPAEVEIPQLFYEADENVLETQKNNQISSELRIAGNSLFSKKDWLGALAKYNESLRYAEIDTENISTAYGNRSACLFHLKLFQKCLVDIEFAIKSNKWLSKLEKRKVESLRLMNNDEAKNDFEIEIPELSYEVDENFPGMANVLEIKKNDEFGRYIVARSNVPVGKTILVEECFASATGEGKFKGCTVCQDTVQNFIACNGCVDAMFCNEKCMKRGGFHAMECGVVSPPGFKQFVIRSLLTGIDTFSNVDELMKFVEGAVKDTDIPTKANDPKSQYHLFLNLNLKGPSKDNNSDYLNSRHIYHIILNFPSMKKLFNSIRKARFLMHLVAYHQLLLSKNAINDVQNACQDISNVGVVFSLFNHQCVPHLLILGLKDRIVGITQRPIKKGDQVFVQYVMDFVENRQEYIKRKFEFECKCDKCKPKKLSNRETLMQSRDQDYQYIYRNQDTDYKLIDEKRLAMKQRCIAFLDKYGQSLSSEVENALNCYRSCIICGCMLLESLLFTYSK
ncbi:uncharacterized protein LOC116347495 [Contarinia nasturtii]|uniref:uncharacterized protein LOC116347495 n=1 Tax=Contarinia nasturtii TaxID=265458 RepID=UPI0012D46594|nr:uncharacterized protein LOC116347495 [Contarinia nasturtii]